MKYSNLFACGSLLLSIAATPALATGDTAPAMSPTSNQTIPDTMSPAPDAMSAPTNSGNVNTVTPATTDGMTPSTPSSASDVVTVPMISGGVGEHELDTLKSVEKQYNFKLVLTEKDGVYLASVPVKITDAKGAVVIDTVTKGPVLLATLPAGSYKVTAMSEGETQQQKVTTGGKSLKTVQLRFRTVDPRESNDSPTQ